MLYFPSCVTREEQMEFDHEGLDVYQASLTFAKLAMELINTFPSGPANLSDQLKKGFCLHQSQHCRRGWRMLSLGKSAVLSDVTTIGYRVRGHRGYLQNA